MISKKQLINRQVKLQAFINKKYPDGINNNLHYNMIKNKCIYDISDVIIWSIIIIEYKNRATDYVRI